MKTLALAVASLAALACGAPAAEPSATSSSASRSGGSSRTLFVRSAVEHPDFTVTLPLHRGRSGGDTVWYVILDSSSGSDADALGVNRSRKLENARGTGAVQQVSVAGGEVEFPATVNFSYATRTIVAGPTGFPPTPSSTRPGARTATARSSSCPTAPSATRPTSPTPPGSRPR